MATEQNLQYFSFSATANADLSASPYCFVTINSTAGTLGLPRVDLSAAAANADGVLQDKPNAAGKTCTVSHGGLTKITASAAIAIGSKIGCAANGQARVAVTSDYIMGTAIEAATAQGQIISMLLIRGGKL